MIIVAAFVSLGIAAGVQSNLPFPLLTILTVLPAIGLVPWFAIRIKQPFAAIILAGFTVFSMKLIGCIIARFVYGPDYISKGYVAADWRTAKLMLTTFWSLTTLVSIAAAIDTYKRFAAKSNPMVSS